LGTLRANSDFNLNNPPRKANICAVVITYFPDLRFGERLDRIRRQVGKTIIVDNTGDTSAGSLLTPISRADCEIIRNKENLGIGAALNQGVFRALELGYEWVITFDQDSWVHADLLETLVEIYQQQVKTELVGIIGCNFEDENTRVPLLKSSSGTSIFRSVEAVITSGSLLSLAVFSKIGPFRSDFFIDFVDHEYCLRLLKAGYKVIISTAPLMTHALGIGQRLAFCGGRFSIYISNRSPLRRYYMTRNVVLVAEKYFSVAPAWMLRSLASLLVLAVLKIPLEKHSRSRKFCATVLGLFDGIRSKTGKAQASWLYE
jgi:rhamnosyltransferase